ncbi:alkaline phosphatase PhoX [Embleya sp. NBC_00896]|uniref:alkaline phosphatase PhoX n=1 Tax=Embleya sp. NBC_00896 TaxID=2975961 RepID=UPI00386A2391|nr:PhoX family protein [Embleya sp. NBC_00896]
MQRRTFLTRTAVVAGGAAALAGPFQGVAAAGELLARRGGGRPPHTPGYGPLRPVPDALDGKVRLHLPEGFGYRSFGAVGTPMSDGYATPGRHDGMAAFRGPNGSTVLVRNHEVPGVAPAFGDPALAYDPRCGGGTTTLTIDRRGRLVDDRVSINGTQMNCNGGPMPWGSWLTCEETVDGPDVKGIFPGQDNSLLTQKHGYLFEVPLHGRARRTPIRAAGRFLHESAAYDPLGGALYLTEDNFLFPSGFYRYTPPGHPERVGRLLDGGRLQMLAIAGRPGAELHLGQRPGACFDVTWVDIDDPDPQFAPNTPWTAAAPAVGNQGRAKGAAQFSRLEGSIHCDGVVYFVSTQGGATAPGDELPPSPVPLFGAGRGQVWAYDVRRRQLRLVCESPHSSVLDLPDNITCSPGGSLVLCEDGDGDNFLRGLTPAGRIFDIARLEPLDGDPDAEFAGATFGPSGDTLFVNIQSAQGRSFAIHGPWRGGGC